MPSSVSDPGRPGFVPAQRRAAEETVDYVVTVDLLPHLTQFYRRGETLSLKPSEAKWYLMKGKIAPSATTTDEAPRPRRRKRAEG